MQSVEDLKFIIFNPKTIFDFDDLIGSKFTCSTFKNLTELERELKREPYSLIVSSAFNTSKKMTWLKKFPGAGLIHLSRTREEMMAFNCVEWLNLEMSVQEFQFRLEWAMKKHAVVSKMLKQEMKRKREAEIQNQVNDRLLKVSVELKAAKEKIEELSLVDALTKLGNRRMFDQEIVKELGKAKRYDTGLCLIFLDIDNFKHVNDTYGHQKGDDILRELGQIIKDSLRDTDWASRYGGEEFCVVLPMTTEEGALNVAERLRHRVEVDLGKALEQTFTVSIGLSKFDKGLNLKDWIERADKAVYYSKQHGKNKVTYFSSQTKECCEYSSGRAQPDFKRI